MSSDHRIYPSIPEYTPLSKNVHVRPSQYIHPPQNIPPLFNNYMQPSQNLPLPLRNESTPPPFNYYNVIFPESTPPSQNIPPFQKIYMCNPPSIHPSLPEYTPPFQQLYATLPEYTPSSQNIPLSSTTTCIILCDDPRIYPSLPEYTPLFNNYMRPSQNLPLPLGIHPRPFYNYMRYSKNYMYKYETIYHLLPELKKYPGREG